MLELEETAHRFSARGSGRRLEVLPALVRTGHRGPGVRRIQERAWLPASTLAYPLRFLAAGGLAAFLLRECCVEAGDPAAPHTAHESR